MWSSEGGYKEKRSAWCPIFNTHTTRSTLVLSNTGHGHHSFFHSQYTVPSNSTAYLPTDQHRCGGVRCDRQNSGGFVWGWRRWEKLIILVLANQHTWREWYIQSGNEQLESKQMHSWFKVFTVKIQSQNIDVKACSHNYKGVLVRLNRKSVDTDSVLDVDMFGLCLNTAVTHSYHPVV